MHKFSCLFLLALLLSQSPAWGQGQAGGSGSSGGASSSGGTGTASGSGSTSSGASMSTGTDATLKSVLPTPKALSLSLANGLINYVNGHQRATLLLRWDLLPSDPELLEEVTRYSADELTVDFSNKWLAHGKDPKDPAYRKEYESDLKNVFAQLFKGDPNASEPSTSSLEAIVNTWNSNTINAWTVPDPTMTGTATPGFSLLKQGGLQPIEYYGLLRDHAIVAFLLRNSGIGMTVDITGAAQTQKLQDKLTWHIRRYRFTRAVASSTGGANATNTIFVYRYVIWVDAPKITTDVAVSGQTETTFKVSAQWLNTNQAVSINRVPQLDFDTSGDKLKLVPLTDNSLNQISATSQSSYLEALLQFGSGTTLGDVVSKGILGGTRNASPFTGAVVSDKHISGLTGIILEANPADVLRAGLLFGIRPDGNALFLGPSLALDVLQLSIGLQIDQLSDTTRTSTSSRIAGAVSFDLSRLLGSKTTVTSLKVKNPTAGGDFGVASEQVAQSLGLAQFTLYAPANAPNVTITLIRMKDESGAAVTGADQTVIRLIARPPANPSVSGSTLIPVLQNQFRFLPRGIYQINVPDGYELLIYSPDTNIAVNRQRAMSLACWNDAA